MGIFGWSYPPGVSRLPWDEDFPCDVCGKMSDNCICPECDQCNEFGDLRCYEMDAFGKRSCSAAEVLPMVRNDAQKASYAEYETFLEAERVRDMESYMKE